MNVKKAEGYYNGVHSLTESEAKQLAVTLFDDNHGRKTHVKAEQIEALGDFTYRAGIKRQDITNGEAHYLVYKGIMLKTLANLIRARLARKLNAYMPHVDRLNFIASDRNNAVYCFDLNKKILFTYDGVSDLDKIAKNSKIVY